MFDHIVLLQLCVVCCLAQKLLTAWKLVGEEGKEASDKQCSHWTPSDCAENTRI